MSTQNTNKKSSRKGKGGFLSYRNEDRTAINRFRRWFRLIAKGKACAKDLRGKVAEAVKANPLAAMHAARRSGPISRGFALVEFGVVK